MVRKGTQHFPFRKAVQFFWKGIGKQYLSGQVERKGKGKVLWRTFSFPFFTSMTIIFTRKIPPLA